MKYAINASKSRLWSLALFVSVTGCAFEEQPETAVEAEQEEVGTLSSAVVNGWTDWSTSTSIFPGKDVGCHSGSLVTAIERQGSKTRLLCTPYANTQNTDSTWTQWVPALGNSRGCGSDRWVTGYQSSSWNEGSGFRLRCSKTTYVSGPNAGKQLMAFNCQNWRATNNSGPAWFDAGYFLNGGGCGTTCANLNWSNCRVRLQ